MRQGASLLARHRAGVLASFDLPVDNSAVEAMNARAKAISIRARGYRSPRVFSTVGYPAWVASKRLLPCTDLRDER